jgi:anaerobic selenocysteine-containing dehydrogenase
MALANDPEVVRGACRHDCSDTCAWEVTVEGGRVVQLRGVEDHPFTVGELCPKVNRYLDRVYDPDWLLTPLRRIPGTPKGEPAFEPFGRWGPGANAQTNPTVGRRLGSAAFHETMVEVARLPERHDPEMAEGTWPRR